MPTYFTNSEALEQVCALVLKKLFEFSEWGRGDSNPHGSLHMILSHARLPIPALPRI